MVLPTSKQELRIDYVWVLNAWQDTTNQNREGRMGEFEHNGLEMMKGLQVERCQRQMHR